MNRFIWNLNVMSKGISVRKNRPGKGPSRLTDSCQFQKLPCLGPQTSESTGRRSLCELTLSVEFREFQGQPQTMECANGSRYTSPCGRGLMSVFVFARSWRRFRQTGRKNRHGSCDSIPLSLQFPYFHIGTENDMLQTWDSGVSSGTTF